MILEAPGAGRLPDHARAGAPARGGNSGAEGGFPAQNTGNAGSAGRLFRPKLPWPRDRRPDGSPCVAPHFGPLRMVQGVKPDGSPKDEPPESDVDPQDRGEVERRIEAVRELKLKARRIGPEECL